VEVDGVQMHILPVASEDRTCSPDESERCHHSPDDTITVHAQHGSSENVSRQVVQGPRLKNTINTLKVKFHFTWGISFNMNDKHRGGTFNDAR
jgi:hypothetical protein